mmetsp:Transcript_25375/g.34908  ORF Transcript_25375/g.34908 Transcript_25375/m.34908 type:complete len:209 (-) Transcript_25375:2266-2892(-)
MVDKASGDDLLELHQARGHRQPRRIAAGEAERSQGVAAEVELDGDVAHPAAASCYIGRKAAPGLVQLAGGVVDDQHVAVPRAGVVRTVQIGSFYSGGAGEWVKQWVVAFGGITAGCDGDRHQRDARLAPQRKGVHGGDGDPVRHEHGLRSLHHSEAAPKVRVQVTAISDKRADGVSIGVQRQATHVAVPGVVCGEVAAGSVRTARKDG